MEDIEVKNEKIEETVKDSPEEKVSEVSEVGGFSFEKEEKSKESPQMQVQAIQASNLEKKKIGDIDVMIDRNQSVADQAKDLVAAAATAKAIQDEELVEDITSLKKEELKASAESSLKQEQAKSKNFEKDLQAANYGVYSGIADLIGLKKPLPNAMLKVLMLVLMPLLIAYYVVFGIITGIVNITMDCVNSVVVRFADFTKAAKKVIISVAIIAAIGLVFFVVWSLLTKYGIIQ